MAAYFSEVSITGDSPQEFLEIAVTAGTNTSSYSVVHYMGNGEVFLTYSLGTVESTTGGKDVYTIDDSDPDVPVTTGEGNEMGNIYSDDSFALVDDTGTVIQYISFYDNNITATEGPANGMTSTMIGTPGFGQSLQSDNDGSSYYTQSSPNRNSIPCFGSDTFILTETGYRLAKNLRLGDRILTLDNGPQPIRWIRQYTENLQGAPTSKKPVCIMVGALGPSCPKTDLTISPQHRILVGGGRQLKELGNAEMLVPAKSLADLPKVEHLKKVDQMVWVHFALDRHEVVFANGTEVETLLLSEHVLSRFPKFQRTGLREIAETHRNQLGRLRPILTVSQARRKIDEAVLAAA